MKERPIIFSGPMVRAILEGRKKQTRRVVKPHALELLEAAAMVGECKPLDYPDNDWDYIADFSPYGVPGDRLWVRETTEKYCLPNILTGEPMDGVECGEYTADGAPVVDPLGFDLCWWYSRAVCPSIHMPRWASRITLEIKSIRVERLQDISEVDAKAEGVNDPAGSHGVGYVGRHIDGFAALWQSINGPDSWAANPWVWVIEFSRVERPVISEVVEQPATALNTKE